MTVAAFTVEQVSRLARLSTRQLRYWERSGFYPPEFRDPDVRGIVGRLYSFRDVVGLATVGRLRPCVPLQELRKVSDYLHARYTQPWSTMRFYILGKRVYFREPDTGAISDRQGQRAMPFDLGPIEKDVRKRVELLTRRTRREFGRVVRDRRVLHNTPIMAGTRIPTRTIWEFAEAGYSAEQIVKEFPRLTLRDVTAAIAFEETARLKQTG